MPEWTQADLGILAAGEITCLIALDARVDLRGCGQAMTFQALLALGDGAPFLQERLRRSAEYRMDDLFTLVYTSGTTGEPKGVMLDHANLAAALRLHVGRLKVGPGDVSLCMLPLSHIFERAWSFYVLYRGGVNVYLRDPQTVIQALGEVKPTLMCGVPRIYEKAYAGIQEKVAGAKGFRRRLFHWAVAVGIQRVRGWSSGSCGPCSVGAAASSPWAEAPCATRSTSSSTPSA
jgi:long-chain acyl-CoA synthetase